MRSLPLLVALALLAAGLASAQNNPSSASAPALFGGFGTSGGGQAQGSWAKFAFDPTSGALTGFAVDPTGHAGGSGAGFLAVWDLVQAQGWTAGGTPANTSLGHGAWLADGGAARIAAYDNPRAALEVRAAQPLTIALQPSAGVSLKPLAGAGAWLVNGTGFDGRLVLTEQGTLAPPGSAPSGTPTDQGTGTPTSSTSDGSNGTAPDGSSTSSTQAPGAWTASLPEGGSLVFLLRAPGIGAGDMDALARAVANGGLAGEGAVSVPQGTTSFQAEDLGAVMGVDDATGNQATLRVHDNRFAEGRCGVPASAFAESNASSAPCNGYAVLLHLDLGRVTSLGNVQVSVDGAPAGRGATLAAVLRAAGGLSSGLPSGGTAPPGNPGQPSSTSTTGSTTGNGTTSTGGPGSQAAGSSGGSGTSQGNGTRATQANASALAYVTVNPAALWITDVLVAMGPGDHQVVVSAAPPNASPIGGEGAGTPANPGGANPNGSTNAGPARTPGPDAAMLLAGMAAVAIAPPRRG